MRRRVYCICLLFIIDDHHPFSRTNTFFKMDYEDVINTTPITNKSGAITAKQSRKDISHEIVFIVFCALAFFADVLIAFTILRFKQMRNARNLLIANWAIMDLCSLLVTPSGYRLLSILYQFDISSTAACALYKVGSVLHYMVIVCVFVLLLDWFIAAYFRRFSRRLRAYNKIALGFIWGLFVIFATLYSYSCKHAQRHSWLHFFIMFVTLASLAIFTIILRIVVAVQKCRKRPLEYSKLALHLGTCFVVCYAIAIVNALLVFVFYTHSTVVAYISACLIFCNAIANLTILYFCDLNFQAHFDQIFKCRKPTDGRFSDISFQMADNQLTSETH